MRNRILQASEPSPRARRSVERALAPRYSAALEEVQQWMDAGRRVMRVTGSVDPRVSEIVREAGLSNQSFYRHFRSKDELLLAILDDGTRILSSYLVHRMEGADTSLAAIEAWMQGVVAQALDPDAAEATRPFVSHHARLAERFPEEIAESAEQLFAPLRDAIAGARAAGVLPGADPARDAQAVYHVLMGWVQRRLIEGVTPSEADAEHIVAFARCGLQRAPVGTDATKAGE